VDGAEVHRYEKHKDYCKEHPEESYEETEEE
jgi:hypothetical protein